MKNKMFLLYLAVLALTPATQAADIIGTITLNGTPPAEVPYTPLMNDPTCGAMYKATPTTHFYVVGPNHELGDVVVYLKDVTGKSTGASQPPVVLDQKGCLYQPQILAVQTGQKLIVKNSDPCIHNVHCAPKVEGNPESNQVQMPGSADLTFTFPKPEMFITFRCDVHPWMFAWVSVFDSPYYCITDKEGKFDIKNVPPGKYTVEADHRKLGTQTQDVEVKDSNVTANFTFNVK
ncbi:MAG TPA: carboxypeptidase regulatory-like domain-containing protein [Candidatus Saccharimonadales bacterium]|nr:carboxypeptidase regulatory-like domain-containing protein [Candidatus Saccharimonadales bacterium]